MEYKYSKIFIFNLYIFNKNVKKINNESKKRIIYNYYFLLYFIIIKNIYKIIKFIIFYPF